MAGMPRGEICASKNIFKEIRRPVCTDALHVKVMKTKSPMDMCVCVLHHHMTGDRVKL